MSKLVAIVFVLCTWAPSLASAQRQPMVTAEQDHDRDGVVDAVDLCPLEPFGAQPDPVRRGCPAVGAANSHAVDHSDPDAYPDDDADADGVRNAADQCPTQPTGVTADPMRVGCPSPDIDNDVVADSVDACPQEPGPPSADPRRNGCPNPLVLRTSVHWTLDRVYFRHGRAELTPASLRTLRLIVSVLARLRSSGSHLAIEGHTDSQATHAANDRLARRRAQRVAEWLIARGVPSSILERRGFAEQHPVASNATATGRAQNNRVEFRIQPSATTP